MDNAKVYEVLDIAKTYIEILEDRLHSHEIPLPNYITENGKAPLDEIEQCMDEL